MQVKKIEKKNEGKYITRYDVTYLLDNGEEKVYEIISRDKNITDIFCGTHHGERDRRKDPSQ